jgi:hypothetical protein
MVEGNGTVAMRDAGLQYESERWRQQKAAMDAETGPNGGLLFAAIVVTSCLIVAVLLLAVLLVFHLPIQSALIWLDESTTGFVVTVAVLAAAVLAGSWARWQR